MSGEFKDTKRALPYSLAASVLVVTALYVMINAAYLKVLTPAEIIGSEAVASDIFARMFGPYGSVIVAFAILIFAPTASIDE